MDRLGRSRFVFASLIAACSSTSDVVPNGGDPSAASDAGADGSTTPLSGAATSSPNLAKCTVACKAPSNGPCANVDVNICVEKCTALTDGLSARCATCMVENAQYVGKQCVASPCGARCPNVACDYPSCTLNGCDTVSGGEPVACDKACMPSDEKCDGVKLGETTGPDCSAACKDG